MRIAEQAQQLLQQAGNSAYDGADYDLAYIYWLFGRVLKINRKTAEALVYLQQAQQHFEALGEKGERMATASLTEQGECLHDLGQLEQAVQLFQRGIKQSKKRGAVRDIAICKLQLAKTKKSQEKYQDALQCYQQALQLFQQLNDNATIARINKDIGTLYQRQSQFQQAETAYQQSLSIFIQLGEHLGEVDVLGELGLLYIEWNRPEQALGYYQQAVEIVCQSDNLYHEGSVRHNLALALLKLNYLDKARLELLRAIECQKSGGYTVFPWLTWGLLYDLEQATNNPQAAQNARQKAIHAFLAYRRNGGENYELVGRLALMVLEAIQQNNTVEIQQTIEQLLETWQSKTYRHHLQSILNGDRNSALAEDSGLNYQQVVELKILLEQLQKTGN